MDRILRQWHYAVACKWGEKITFYEGYVVFV